MFQKQLARSRIIHLQTERTVKHWTPIRFSLCCSCRR